MSFSFEKDIYLDKNYVALFGELFEFEFKKDEKYFKLVANKNKIKNSEFYDLSSAYGYSSIFANTSDTSFLNEALSALKSRCFDENIIAIFLRLHPYDVNLSFFEKKFDFFEQNRKLVVLELKNDINETRSSYSPRMRTCVRKARKELKIEFADEKDKDSFVKFYEKSMKSLGASSFYFFNKDYHNALFNFEQYYLLKASYENQILGFVSFFLGADFSYYHLGATSKLMNANAALLDFSFEFMSLKKSKICILGGGLKDDDSLYKFKSKFSKQNAKFYIGGIITNEKAYNELCEAHLNSKFLKYRF